MSVGDGIFGTGVIKACLYSVGYLIILLVIILWIA